MFSAHAGAALGRCRGGVGAVWGVAVVASSWRCPQHHDVVETIRAMLLL